MAKDLDRKSPLEIMDQACHSVASLGVLAFPWSAAVNLTPRLLQALKLHGDDIGIAFSGAEDVALIEYAHLTGRPYRVFRYYRATLIIYSALACTAFTFTLSSHHLVIQNLSYRICHTTHALTTALHTALHHVTCWSALLSVSQHPKACKATDMLLLLGL